MFAGLHAIVKFHLSAVFFDLGSRSVCSTHVRLPHLILSGTSSGMLQMLILLHSDGQVTGLRVESLGVTSTPSSLAYLDDGVVYVGSLLGDSKVSYLRLPKLPCGV